jgi:hypothetical protein
MNVRCSKTSPQPKIPDGVPMESARAHPLWKWYLEPGGCCILEDGHDGPHRVRPPGQGGLVWHDPQLLVVGGDVVEEEPAFEWI